MDLGKIMFWFKITTKIRVCTVSCLSPLTLKDSSYDFILLRKVVSKHLFATTTTKKALNDTPMKFLIYPLLHSLSDQERKCKLSEEPAMLPSGSEQLHAHVVISSNSTSSLLVISKITHTFAFSGNLFYQSEIVRHKHILIKSHLK